jgi:cytochrome c oxidase subunit II
MMLAALSDYFDLNKLMGMLPNNSEHGKEIDHMLNFCHWFMLLLFMGWGSFYLYTIWRFRKSRHPRADYHGVRTHLSTHLEVGVIIIEAVILLGFALPLWGKRVNEIPEGEKETALKIRAIGYQFGWYFHYAGADGKFGSTSASSQAQTRSVSIPPIRMVPTTSSPAATCTSSTTRPPLSA